MRSWGEQPQNMRQHRLLRSTKPVWFPGMQPEKDSVMVYFIKSGPAPTLGHLGAVWMFRRWKFNTEARSKRLRSNRERVKSSFSVTKGRVNFRYQHKSSKPFPHCSTLLLPLLSLFICVLNVGIFQGLHTFSLLTLIAFICYLIKMWVFLCFKFMRYKLIS